MEMRMLWGKPKNSRREPVLGTHGSLYGLKLSPSDRAGGPLEVEERPRPAPKSRETPPAPKKSKPKKTKRKLKSRGLIGKLIYWCFVLGVWSAIALTALIGWHMMKLPAINS